jgi:hypothetical protein
MSNLAAGLIRLTTELCSDALAASVFGALSADCSSFCSPPNDVSAGIFLISSSSSTLNGQPAISRKLKWMLEGYKSHQSGSYTVTAIGCPT